MVTRIAMWSGPRNISTAMMRSFGARDDATVLDEPFYSYYLSQTGLEHPGRDEIIASQPVRWQDVVTELEAPLPDGIAVQYQKQMTHHVLPEMLDGAREWISGVQNAYLIRDPARVIASYAQVRERPTLADLGFAQQAMLFEQFGGPVVDADDLLEDPQGVLAALCAALGIGFDPAMLSWPAGPRDSDGVWAPHWYASVEGSTGFASPTPWTGQVPEDLKHLVDDATSHYERLASYRLSPASRN